MLFFASCMLFVVGCSLCVVCRVFVVASSFSLLACRFYVSPLTVVYWLLCVCCCLLLIVVRSLLRLVCCVSFAVCGL